ncbi:hypothetical protein [Microcoleus sp.]|uniref:hypothetical protein n=1 Tax=Microcoleus sp. TaxID=44472 RepID=UPI00403EAFF0
MGASPMAMPTEAYALCPMPYEHLMLLRKAIISGSKPCLHLVTNTPQQRNSKA